MGTVPVAPPAPGASVSSNTGSPVVFLKSARTIVSLSVSCLAWPRCCQKKNPPAARISVAAAAIPYFRRGLASRRCGAAGLESACRRCQIVAQFRGGWIPQRAILFQKLANDPLQFGRDLRIALANRLGRLVQERVEDDRGRRPVKRPRPRHHFVQNHAERPQIAARIHGLAASLFRRHVRDRAHGRARLGEHRPRSARPCPAGLVMYFARPKSSTLA